jgi:hypothetical protein
MTAGVQARSGMAMMAQASAMSSWENRPKDSSRRPRTRPWVDSQSNSSLVAPGCPPGAAAAECAAGTWDGPAETSTWSRAWSEPTFSGRNVTASSWVLTPYGSQAAIMSVSVASRGGLMRPKTSRRTHPSAISGWV